MSKTDMQTTHYTIYKTTNLVNNKVYIGKHITKNLNDDYLGSGKLLHKAIDKYGVENFSKEILHVFENEDDMNAKEREIVTEEFVLQESNYNLCVGGKGGWSYVNQHGLGVSDAQKQSAKHTMGVLWNKCKDELLKDPDWREAYSRKLSESSARKGKAGTFTGKTHTKETKDKMSAKLKGKGTGKRNSQFGTRWITDGVQNKKIQRDDVIPMGWYTGRTQQIKK